MSVDFSNRHDLPQKRFSRALKLAVLFFTCLSCLPLRNAWAQSADIDATQTAQSIRGFGASSAYSSANGWPSTLDQLFFDPVNGIGLSMLRTRIPPDGLTNGWASVNSESQAMKIAQSYGVTQIWSTEWTPPAAYKDNASVSRSEERRVGK